MRRDFLGTILVTVIFLTVTDRDRTEVVRQPEHQTALVDEA